MSSAALLDQDFGSESEDDNFNPAPADDSDNEAAGDSDAEVSSKPTKNGADKRRRSIKEGNGDEEGEEDTEATQPLNGTGLHSNVPRQNGEGEEDDNDSGDEDIDGADDDEDEEDEEDEEAVGRPRKRSRRDPRNQYLDVEAEVDEEDEGDEEDDEGQADPFIADIHPDDINDLPLGAETDDRRHRELDQQREHAQQMDAEKQAQRLKELYGRSRTTAARDGEIVPKRMLVADIKDASIWGVKCKPGKEREVVFAITKRMEERAAKNPLPIISALERGGTMIGYVYIEALKQADVYTALDGISNVYPRTKVLLVPIPEREDLLRVTKSEQLQPGGYVRIKRGKYVGDLAQIDDVETNGLEVTLKIVPRLDYGLNEDANAPMVDGNIKGDAKRKRQKAYGMTNPATRPPQRLFSEVEAKKKHSKYLSSMSTFNKKNWTYLNDNYVDGYLVKEYKIQHLITKNVNPTLEEVTKFTAGAADGTENLDLAALAQSLKNTSANESYLPGDMVEVYEGEQTGVCGKAISVRGDIVTLSVTDGEIQGQTIEVPVKGLRKRFKEGEHVKVIGGSRYRDEVGMVVAIKNDTVTILSDLSMQEITVFSKDLREATDSGVAGGLGRYDIHDLVQLDAATVGCVTKVDRESLRVLDQNGSVRSILPSQISNKIEKRRNAVATDRNGNEIRTEDTVREIGGEQKQGVILHIYRSFLFLHNREQTENSGISVVRTNNVATVAAKGGRVTQGASTGPDLARMNPALQRNGANGANGNSAMPPPKSFGRDRALGQTVTIRRGPYKGLLGIVKDTTDSEARVELHTKGKTITVPKDTLGFKDALTGQSIDYQRFAGGRGRGIADRGGFGGGTPGRNPDWQSSSRTPVPGGPGGRTPAWAGAGGARTPAWQGGTSSSRTPAWSQNAMSGARTPAYGAPGGATVNPYDGSRTAYSGAMAGGRTPAWNPTAGSTTYTDPFSTSTSTGGKTPAYDPSSSRTPAYQQAPPPQHSQHQQQDPYNSRPYDAPTPGKDVHAAPTPSGYANAPTPMAQQAPTPKFSGYAADAPTPYSGQPETPAWDGDGEGEEGGPRYEEGTPSP